MRYDRAELEAVIAAGMEAFRPRPRTSLLEWAEQNFYLSAESSYVEQHWRSWPFQRAILAAMGDDRIEEVTFKKSARVGWTVMILAAVGYFAQHKRRNQALWQPTDDDRDEFVKASIDPMLRDVALMRDVMPQVKGRSADNTLQLKKFVGSTLYLRGGKAAKNYRRISPDVCYLDEVDGFDKDVEKEGSPFILAWKRNEGATFRKRLAGSTPKEAGQSLIEGREAVADVRYRREMRCPDCDGWHELIWDTSEDAVAGIRWVDGDAETARHVCPHCGVLIDQGQYLEAVGRWKGSDGSLIDDDGVFRDAGGAEIDPARHVAFYIWTAYSPAASWADIVREFQAADAKLAEGDDTSLKTFTNTTLGQTYAGQVDSLSEGELDSRVRPFPLRIVPRECLVLLAGADTQDNRIEVGVWGFGRGSQMWTIDHQVFWGSPSQDSVWKDVDTWFSRTYPHASGMDMRVTGLAIDTQGHHTQAVYDWVWRHRKGSKIYAVRGKSVGEKAIQDTAGPVEINWRGQRRPNGVMLWNVGTNMAKDLLFARLHITDPGPGYIHVSQDTDQEWRRQLVGEVRMVTPSGQTRWVKTRRRVEVLDCAVYALWLEEAMGLRRWPDHRWRELEEMFKEAPGRQDPAVAPPPRVVDTSVSRRFSLSGSGRFGGSRAG